MERSVSCGTHQHLVRFETRLQATSFTPRAICLLVQAPGWISCLCFISPVFPVTSAIAQAPDRISASELLIGRLSPGKGETIFIWYKWMLPFSSDTLIVSFRNTPGTRG